MSNTPINVLVQGDRFQCRNELFNLGDRALEEGFRNLLNATGWNILSGPWKPFPYFNFPRFKSRAEAGGAEKAFEGWYQQITSFSPARAGREESWLRQMDRSCVFDNALVRGIEARLRNRHGFRLREAAKPYLFRNYFARQMVSLIDQADFVCFLGGGLLAEHLLEYVPSFLFQLYLAKRRGRKVVTLSQTIAVQNPVARQALSRVYGMIDAHVVREPISREALLALGVPEERIMVLPDFAFAIARPWERPPVVELGAESIPPGSVALTVRGDRAVALDCWAECIRQLDAAGHAVYFLYTCRGLDEGTARRLADRCPLRFLSRDHDYPELIGLMRHFDLIITDRFHGAVFSLLAGAPVLAMESSTVKMAGLFRSMEYPVPVHPPLGAATYGALLSTATDLLRRVPEIRRAAENCGRQATAALKKNFHKAFELARSPGLPVPGEDGR